MLTLAECFQSYTGRNLLDDVLVGDTLIGAMLACAGVALIRRPPLGVFLLVSIVAICFLLFIYFMIASVVAC